MKSLYSLSKCAMTTGALRRKPQSRLSSSAYERPKSRRCSTNTGNGREKSLPEPCSVSREGIFLSILEKQRGSFRLKSKFRGSGTAKGSVFGHICVRLKKDRGE